MTFLKTLTGKMMVGVLAAGLVMPAVPTFAQDHSGAIKARQGQFRLMALNLGILGAMAKGEMDYDAELAQIAADNLVTVSMINQMTNWPQGSDNGAVEGTRALPVIWENLPDVISKWEDFGTSAQAMQAAAGDGVDGIRGAIGQVGGACKACHDKYRAPN